MRRLTPPHRQAVVEVEVYFNSRTCAELAAEMGVSASTMRCRLYYGMRGPAAHPRRERMAGRMSPDCLARRLESAECLMLGIPLPGALALHVGRCRGCAHEVSELGDVVRTLRQAEPFVRGTPLRGDGAVGRRSADRGTRRGIAVRGTRGLT